MAIERRVGRTGKSSYRVRIRHATRGEISETFARKQDAEHFAAQLRIQMRSSEWDTGVRARQFALGDAIDRYLELLPTYQLRDGRSRHGHALWWRERLGHVALADLRPALIAEVRDALLAGKTESSRRRQRVLGPATVVRYLASLSSICSKAVNDWQMMTDNPVKRVTKPREPEGRVRFLSDVELPTLLHACRQSSSGALYTVVVLALSTGMRKGEILKLRWKDVDLANNVIRLDCTKNGRRRQVPLEGEARERVASLAESSSLAGAFVFPGKQPGKHLDIAKAWSTAVRKAYLDDFRFHDLRHTTASYLAMRGASLLEIGNVLGHRSIQMTQRYAHISNDRTREVLAGMVNAVLPSLGQATPERLSG